MSKITQTSRVGTESLVTPKNRAVRTRSGGNETFQNAMEKLTNARRPVETSTLRTPSVAIRGSQGSESPSPGSRAIQVTTHQTARSETNRTPVPVANRSNPSTNQTTNQNTPQVVQSPFNVLGLPVRTSPAPTAADVAKNPQQYAGTSFDPSRSIAGPWSRAAANQIDDNSAPAGFGLGFGWTPEMYAAHTGANQPPEGSLATTNPDVFVMPSGATWHRPGARVEGTWAVLTEPAERGRG